MSDAQSDPYREKYRPDDADLNREVDAALEGVSLDELYATADGAAAQSTGGSRAPDQPKGPRRGRVVSIGKDDVFIDLGGKSQGVCPILQFDDVKVGDELDFYVDRYDPREGLLLLNRQGAAISNVTWENLEVGQIVEGLVTGMNKGGLELQVKGMRAFMPAGQVNLFFEKDISVYLGQKLASEVTQFDHEKKNLVLSRRNVLEREKEQARAKLLEEIEEGQIRRGAVRSVTDYGAFIDLGGLDGLLHVSEMSFRRGAKPADFVKPGDVVDVKVIKFDRESGKLSLSLKQAMGVDPWAGAPAKYGVGTEITGRVTKVENFGAFIEVEEGLEGLLPVSEISWQRIRHPADVVKEGDTIRLVVIALDPEARRLTFSLKQAGPDPWKEVESKYPRDAIVSGTVVRVVDFGAFVELEPGLEGLVHISEISDQRVRTPADAVKPGQAVQVRVIEAIPEARRISLSIRRANVVEKATEQAIPAPAAAATKPKKPKKLKGGLEF